MKHIYFHHLVGTAGSSFSFAIERSKPSYLHYDVRGGLENYEIGDTSIFFGDNSKKRCLFKGHNMNGLLEKAGINGKYITLLRHPYERLLTDWFWAFFNSNEFSKTNLSWALDEFYTFVSKTPHLEFYIHHIGVLGYMHSQHFCYEECSLVENSKALSKAHQAIKEKYSFIGIMEHFDLSLWAFAKFANISKLSDWRPYRHPTTVFRPSFSELPLEIQNYIKEKTQHDVRFYSEIREGFEKKYLSVRSKKAFRDYFEKNNKFPKAMSVPVNKRLDANTNSYEILKKRIKNAQQSLSFGPKIAYVGIGSDFKKLVKEQVIHLNEGSILLDNGEHRSFNSIMVKSVTSEICNSLDVIFITSSKNYLEIFEQLSEINDTSANKYLII